jgi:predicted MFS family arabinose efflux permease
VIARVTPPEKRSIALGIATAAGSMGQFLVLPFAQHLIGRLDWQAALLCLAGVAALIVPLAAPMAQRRAPVSAGSQSLREALKQAWREPSFHFLFWGYFVCGFQLLMFTVHLPAFVTDAGLKPEHGMTALALIGFCNMIGTTVAGWLGGRFSKKRLLSIIYLVRGAIIVFLISSPLSPMTLYTFAVLMGLTWLSTVPLTYGLVGQIFGMRYAAMLNGIVFFGHQLGSFTGIWLAGYLFDTTGRYTGAFLISIGLSVLAAVVNLPINEKPLAERAAA